MTKQAPQCFRVSPGSPPLVAASPRKPSHTTYCLARPCLAVLALPQGLGARGGEPGVTEPQPVSEGGWQRGMSPCLSGLESGFITSPHHGWLPGRTLWQAVAARPGHGAPCPCPGWEGRHRDCLLVGAYHVLETRPFRDHCFPPCKLKISLVPQSLTGTFQTLSATRPSVHSAPLLALLSCPYTSPPSVPSSQLLILQDSVKAFLLLQSCPIHLGMCNPDLS